MKKRFEWEWIFSEFADDLGFSSRNMFGCRAAYLDGKLVLIIAESPREPVWNGLLVATSREHHASLMKQFPALRPHSVLGKWLYLKGDEEDFESDAEEISRLVRRRDPRIGVYPEKKSRRPKSQSGTAIAKSQPGPRRVPAKRKK